MKSLKPLFSHSFPRATAALVFLLVTLSGCSVYQTRGRKLLQNGENYTYPGFMAVAHLESCGPVEANKNWQALQGHDETNQEANELQLSLFEAIEADQFLLQISDIEQTRSCQFHFSSELERSEHLKSAIALTELHFSLGEFAFSHKIPLK